MTKYRITIPVVMSDHTTEQSWCSKQITDVGISYKDKRWVAGSSTNRTSSHTWDIKCDNETLAILVLKTGAVIKSNITEEARASGLAKLTNDEKEALGIS